jgi:ATP adenylyltransferase
MKHPLFAPWRMEFIENADDKKGCALCNLYQSKDDEKNHVIDRGKSTYVVMNKYPYSHGHLMVVPYRHENDWTRLTTDELIEMGSFTQKALRVMKRDFQADGFNVGVNLGRAAGAGIEDHVHQHIVPRWVGDFNFMPLFSETKIISEHLDQTFKRLTTSWADQ